MNHSLIVAPTAHLWQQRLAEFEEQLAQCRKALTTDHLHDLRIVLRRWRALLGAAEEMGLVVSVSHLRAELRWLAEQTSALRDNDVLTEFIAAHPALFGAERTDLLAGLAAERLAQVERLQVVLASERVNLLGRDLAASLAEFGAALTDDALKPLLWSRCRHLKRCRRRLKRDSSATAFHALRKEGKRFRYLVEDTEAGTAVAARQALLGGLKQLLADLGQLQDAVVQDARLRTLYGGALPGRLKRYFERRAKQARKHFRQHARRFFHGSQWARWRLLLKPHR